MRGMLEDMSTPELQLSLAVALWSADWRSVVHMSSQYNKIIMGGVRPELLVSTDTPTAFIPGFPSL